MKSDFFFSYFVWKGDETLLNSDRILSALFNSQIFIILLFNSYNHCEPNYSLEIYIPENNLAQAVKLGGMSPLGISINKKKSDIINAPQIINNIYFVYFYYINYIYYFKFIIVLRIL